MTFFTQLAATGLKNASISIQVDANGIMTVAMATKTTATDNAIKALIPIILTGTTAELDEGFFPTINQPVQNTQVVFNNVENYNAQLAETEKNLSASKKAKEEAAQKKVADKKTKNETETAINFDAPKEEVSQAEIVEVEEEIAELIEEVKETPSLKQKPVEITAPAEDIKQEIAPPPPPAPVNPIVEEEKVIPPPPPAPMKVVKNAEEKKLDKKATAITEAEDELRAFVEHPDYDPSNNKWVPVTLYGKLLDLDPGNEYGLSVKSTFRKWKLSSRP